MAGLDPALGLSGTLLDGDPLGNMERLMPVRMGPKSSSLVRVGQIGDQVALCAGRFIIEYADKWHG
jgi:hypothetical protein